MMRTWLFYRLADGTWVDRSISTDGGAADIEAWLRSNTPEGCAALERTAAIDIHGTRVDLETGQVVVDGDRARQHVEASRDEAERANARNRLATIEAGQIRTLVEAVLGDPEALQRLRDSEPLKAAAREVLRRPRPSAAPSAPSPAAPVEPPTE